MNLYGYTDRFIVNLVVSGVVTCWVVFGLYYVDPQVPGVGQMTPVMLVAMSAVFAGATLFVVPLAWRRAMRSRRLLFHEVLRDGAEWRGRLIGLVLGLMAGITLVR